MILRLDIKAKEDKFVTYQLSYFSFRTNVRFIVERSDGLFCLKCQIGKCVLGSGSGNVIKKN